MPYPWPAAVLTTSGVTGSALISCHKNSSLIFATDMLFYYLFYYLFLSMLYAIMDIIEFFN